MKTLHFCFWSKWPKNKMFNVWLPIALYMCFKQMKAKKKNETFMCDFILFLNDKIRAIFELEYLCSVFTFVQYYNTVKAYS